MADKFLDYSGLSRFLDKVKDLIATKMDKNDPSGTGSFSMNRRSGSTIGTNSFAEGSECTASGNFGSHAEGYFTTASGAASHAEGWQAVASAVNSHVEGEGTEAASDMQHVSGKYNVVDPNNTYAEIIGNGIAVNARSNARELDWNGNEYLAGDLTINKGTASEMIVGQAIAGKQDALTAGSNVQISGNTISATDTKPTNHTNVGTGMESVANNTWTDIWTISNLPAGEYIMQIAVAWQSSSSANSDNGTGYRQIELRDTNTAAGSAGWINTCDVQATTGIRTCQQMTCPIRPSSTTTYKLSARHNAGTTIYAIPRIRYVKIE